MNKRHTYASLSGASNPDDNSILYSIETSDGPIALLVDAYGACSRNIPWDIVNKIRLDC